MLCNFRLEFGTCVDCEPTSNVPTFSNFNTRGADSVVVSAYDWLAGGPALMPRRSMPVIFGIDTNTENDTVELCGWRCTVMRHTHTPS